MNSFKEIAHQILSEVNRPLHSKEITKIALDRGWLKTAGKTPEATMNARLVVDINSKKEVLRTILWVKLSINFHQSHFLQIFSLTKG
jgi:hypothetical protein